MKTNEKEQARHFPYGTNKNSHGFQVPICYTHAHDEDWLAGLLFLTKKNEVTCRRCMRILTNSKRKAGGKKATIKGIMIELDKIAFGQTLYLVKKTIKEMGLRRRR